MLIIGYAQDNIVYSKSMDEIVKEDAVRIKKFLNSELQKNDVYNVRPMWVINEWFERYEPATRVEKKDAYLLADIDFDTRGEAGEYTTITLEVTKSRRVGL